MALPEVMESPHFAYTSFRVGGKIFATAPPDGEWLHVFIAEAEREQALRLDPEAVSKLWWGSRVQGLRVELRRAAPAAVQTLLRQAWTRKAPRALLALATGATAPPRGRPRTASRAKPR